MLSITSAFDVYCCDHIAFIGQSKKTEEAYLSTRDVLLKYCGDIDITSIDFRVVRDFKLWLDKGRCENTVRNYIVCLRNVIRFLNNRGYEMSIKVDDIPVPKRIRKPVTYLTEEEFKRLVTVVSTPRRGYSRYTRLRNHAVIEFIFATGLRNSELCSLDRDSIKRNTFTVVGKGTKPRIGFVDDNTLQILNRYLAARSDTSRALFVTKDGTRLTPGNIRSMFARLRDQYPEFQGVHPHTLRHSFATKMLTRGVDSFYVKEFLGHQSLETTQMYLHVVNEELRDVYLKAQKY